MKMSEMEVLIASQFPKGFNFYILQLFGGFLVQLDSVNPWLNWLQHFSIFKYGLEMLYINEFKDRQFCSNNSTCVSGNQYMESQQVSYKEPWDLWRNSTSLLVYACCMLCLTYIQLRRIKKTT